MSDDTFGFGAAKRSMADKVRDFVPEVGIKQDDSSGLSKVDAAGEALGFVSRDTSKPPPRRRRNEVGPTISINMRIPEEVGERFIAFCEQQRMTYWEGVEELMKRANVGT